ncbi:MAG: sulfur carrier protein ThiS [Deltaproteobacteria bacterium]|nr:sulfur carrier protein ThiS [Deltaproteobacteria bacterium]
MASPATDTRDRSDAADAPATRLRVVVNGETCDVADGTTIVALLAALGLGDVTVAVERNAEVVPRARHRDTFVRDGDTIEIVHFVGGG